MLPLKEDNQVGIYNYHGKKLSFHIDGLMQDSNISITNALEILLSYIKPSICSFHCRVWWVFMQMGI